MKNLFIKLFRRGKYVKIIYTGIDKRVRKYYVIPKGKDVTIGNESFILNDDDMFFTKSTPTYFLTCKNSTPVNPLKVEQSLLTADDYDVAINAHVARDIFLASGGNINVGVISLVLSAITLLIVGIIAYIGNNMLTGIYEKIQLIEQYLSSLGIGG